MIVEDNMMVALRYSIKNSSGGVITDIMNDRPFRYLCGSGGILPALENNIRAMNSGDQKSFVLEKAENPGLFEDLYIDVIIDEVYAPAPEYIPISASNSSCSGEDGCC